MVLLRVYFWTTQALFSSFPSFSSFVETDSFPFFLPFLPSSFDPKINRLSFAQHCSA
jgi:hypothetical protein